MNPVPSADARDRYDNSQVFDEYVTGTDLTTLDRLGVSRKTLRGLENDFNIFLEGSSFELPPIPYIDGSPLQIDRPTQLIERSGILYSVKLPQSFPYILTGTWATDEPSLTLRTDQTLRQDLADDTGAGLIGTTNGQTVEQRLVKIFTGDVRAYDVYPNNVTSQVSKFTGTLPTVLVFPTGYYYMGGITAGLFANITFEALGDGPVTIAINGLSDVIEFKASEDVDVVYHSTGRKFSYGRDEGIAAENALKVFGEQPDDWVVRKANTRPTFDVSIDATTGVATEGAALTPASLGRIVMAASTVGKFRGPMARVRPHDVLTAYIDNTTVVRGIAVVGDTYTVVLFASAANRTDYTLRFYQGGSLFQERVLTVVDAGNPAYNSANCDMSIDVVSGSSFVPLVNGARIGEEINVGPIVSAGFVVGDTTSTVNLHGVHFDTYRYARGLKSLSTVCIYGDSTAAPLSYSWDKHLPAAIMALGSYAPPIINNAVGGYAMGNVLNAMIANGFGSANVVVVCAGTNDIQAGLSEGTVRSAAQAIIDYVAAQGRRLVWIEPYIWYPQQPDGIGVVTANAQAGARARLQIKDAVLTSGASWVSTTHLLPAPLTTLTSATVDPLLRDNIHQSESLNMAYASLAAQGIVKLYSAKSDSITWPIGRPTFAGGLVTSSTVAITFAVGNEVSAVGVITLTTTSGEILADFKGALLGPYYQAVVMRGGTTAVACFLVRNGSGQYNVRGATFVAADQVLINIQDRLSS
jgi:hypothetical protein